MSASPFGRTISAALADLARGARSSVGQLAAATALTVAAPVGLLADGTDVPRAFALAFLVAALVEAATAPGYFRDQRDALRRVDRAKGPPPSHPLDPRSARAKAGSWVRGAARVFAALVVAAGARVVFTAVGALPGLAVAILARALGSHSLRAAAETVGAVGVFAMFFAGNLLTCFASRAALFEHATPLRALARSVATAGARWREVTALQLVATFSTIALVTAPRLTPLFVFAIVLHWLRDVAVSELYLGHSLRAPARTKSERVDERAKIATSRGRTLGRRARPALGLFVGLGTIAWSGVVFAQEALISGQDDSVTSAATTPLVHPEPRLTTESVELAPDAQAKFVEQNAKLADAEEAPIAIGQKLAAVNQTMWTQGTTPELLARYQDLQKQLGPAQAIVQARHDELDETGHEILSKAYGSDYGLVARNWIDIKNTPSFLVGMAESTPAGVKHTFTAVGSLIGKGYDKLTGASAPTVTPTAAEARQSRIDERQTELTTELARISDGATVNRLEGNWYGEKLVGPLVLGEAGTAVARAGVAGVSAASEAIVASSRVRLGEGVFSVAYRQGDQVIKVVKEQVPCLDSTGMLSVRTRVVTVAERARLAQMTADFANKVGDNLGGGIVPKLTAHGGKLTQPYASGMTAGELLGAGDEAAFRLARRSSEDMATRAAKSLGLKGPGKENFLLAPDGWHVIVDANTSNFRFSPTGEVVAWFDPIIILPAAK